MWKHISGNTSSCYNIRIGNIVNMITMRDDIIGPMVVESMKMADVLLPDTISSCMLSPRPLVNGQYWAGYFRECDCTECIYMNRGKMGIYPPSYNHPDYIDRKGE